MRACSRLWRQGAIGPTRFSSGPQVNLPANATPRQARAAVAAAKSQGFSSVKLYGRASLENYEAMVAASRELDAGVLGRLDTALEQPPEAFYLSLVSFYRFIHNHAAAAQVLEVARERYPASVLLLNREAEALTLDGQPDEARKRYERALELDPTNGVARRGLAGL